MATQAALIGRVNHRADSRATNPLEPLCVIECARCWLQAACHQWIASCARAGCCDPGGSPATNPFQVSGNDVGESTPIFSEGKLSGCELVFNVLARDYAYRQGGLIKAPGQSACSARRHQSRASKSCSPISSLGPGQLRRLFRQPRTTLMVIQPPKEPSLVATFRHREGFLPSLDYRRLTRLSCVV